MDFCRAGLPCLAAVWLLMCHGVALGAGLGVATLMRPGASFLCKAATQAAEAARHVPDGFLDAIARVESGRADPATGTRQAWPWTVNAEGVGSFYPDKAAAIAAVQVLQARGVKSIDVGCLQVNLMYHPEAFASLEAAFDPAGNALYAAGFLVSLYGQAGSWPLAAAAYHSQTPTLGSAYQKRVLAEWATPDQAVTGEMRRPAPPQPAASRAVAPGAVAAPGLGGFSPIGRMGAIIQHSGAVAAPRLGRDLAAYRLLPTRLARPG